MIRRHPHVFGDAGVMTAAEQTEAWEAIKAEERQANRKKGAVPSVLSEITSGLPPLMRAQKLPKAGGSGQFDWRDAIRCHGKGARRDCRTGIGHGR